MSRKSPRNSFLKTVQKAFSLSLESERRQMPIREMIDQERERSYSRRKMLGDLGKAGIAVASAGILDSCNKASGWMGTRIEIPGAANGTNIASQPTIAIVGAGMAGLNCAYQLSRSGYTSTIYEASTRSGGRIYTKSNIVGNGIYGELGGEFIDSNHTDMINLCKEFNLPLLDTESPTEAVLFRDDFFVDGVFYTESQIIQAFHPYSDRIIADVRSLPNVINYSQSNAAALKFDQMSISSYFDSIGMSGWIRAGLEVAYLTEYGREVNEQTAINFLYLFNPNTNKGFQIFGVSDERYKIAGGSQMLTDALTRKLSKNIVFNYTLVQLDSLSNGQGYKLSFRDANNTVSQIQANIVVMTLPFSILRNVKINVPFPAVKTKCIQELGYGSNSKLFMGFTSRVWRNFNNSGYIFTNGAVQNGYDGSDLQPGTAGCYTILQGGKLGLELSKNTPEYWATKQFLPLLDSPGLWPGSSNAYIPNSAKRMLWPTNPYALGSYACWTVGQTTSIVGAEIEPVGNIYFAGEHCAFDFQGYMNGSAQTGRLAATSVQSAIKSK